jgi:hypothetical protein
MNPDEADRILVIMAATWPAPIWTDDQVALWHDDIGKYDPGDATAALEDLRMHATFRPSPAEFHQAVMAKVRHRQMRASFKKGLPEPTEAKQFGLVHRLATIQAAQTEQHDHRNGNTNCPVCKLHKQIPQPGSTNATHAPDCPRCQTLADGLTP